VNSLTQDDTIVSGHWEQYNRLYEDFKYMAEAISARVHRVKGYTEAAGEIAKIVNELKIITIVTDLSPMVRELNLAVSLDGTGASVHADNLRQLAAGADMGISSADLAIAETGTLGHYADDMEGRLVSMLPPVHLVLVRTDSLVNTLRIALERYKDNVSSLPAYLTFISGPSRTADIERVLTIGVHGPGKLEIIFIDSPGGAIRGGK